MRDGRHFTQIGTEVPGSPQHDVWNDIERKFINCAARAASPHQGLRSKDATDGSPA